MLSGAGTFGDQEIAAHSGYTASVQCSIPTGYRALMPFCYGLQWYTVATLSTTTAENCIYNKKYKMWWSPNWETTFVYFFLTKQKNAIFKVVAGCDNTI